MSMTKGQAKQKIQPLIEEIEAIKSDLMKVTTPASISAIRQLISHKEELLESYREHAG